MRGLLLLLPSSLLACSASLPEVARGPHPPTGGAVPVVVDSEPPPAAIEHVSEPPNDDCSWQDGSWLFQSKGWVWQPGRWVEPKQDCYLAEASLVWVPAVNQPGALFFTPAQWYGRNTGAPCPPPADCKAP
jgi:hypothetical protein